LRLERHRVVARMVGPHLQLIRFADRSNPFRSSKSGTV
jgi:hypothetical protein